MWRQEGWTLTCTISKYSLLTSQLRTPTALRLPVLVQLNGNLRLTRNEKLYYFHFFLKHWRDKDEKNSDITVNVAQYLKFRQDIKKIANRLGKTLYDRLGKFLRKKSELKQFNKQKKAFIEDNWNIENLTPTKRGILRREKSGRMAANMRLVPLRFSVPRKDIPVALRFFLL